MSLGLAFCAVYSYWLKLIFSSHIPFFQFQKTPMVVPTQAVQLTVAMIAILNLHVTSLLRDLPFHPGLVYDLAYNSQLASILHELKVAYDWMSSNKDLWCSTPPARLDNSLKTYKVYCTWHYRCFWKPNVNMSTAGSCGINRLLVIFSAVFDGKLLVHDHIPERCRE